MVSCAKRWLIIVPLVVSALMLTVSCGDTPEDTEATHPQFLSIQANPDTVLPGGTSQITTNVSDPDNGPDTLSFAWHADFGTVNTTSQKNRVNWIAPSDTVGRFPIQISVSDGDNAVTDSAFVTVSRTLVPNDLTATIIQPLHLTAFAISDTVEFVGRLLGLDNYEEPDVSVRWASSVQGTFSTGTVDTLGFSRATLVLDQGIHTITFTGVVDGIWEVNYEIRIDATTASSITLHPIHREYLSNRLTWEYESNADDFVNYKIQRYSAYDPALGFVTIATFTDETARSYVDTTAELGDNYSYSITVNYESGLELFSNVHAIRTGVYTVWQTEIPDMFYDEVTENLILSTPELNPPQINLVDVTANNADGFFWYKDSLKYLTGVPTDTFIILFNPIGFTENTVDRMLYIASQGDPTMEPVGEVFPGIWTLDLDNIYGGFDLAGHTNNQWRGAPQYIDYDNSRNLLFATTDNGYPMIISDPDATFSVSRITDSRVVFARSIPLVDETGGNLYISELGSFPVSLWKYSLSTLPPTLLLDDVNTGLGYNMQDVILTADRNSLLLANESPEYVQQVSVSDFSATGSYETGPGAMALELSDDGNSLFIGVNNEVQKWDVSSGEMVDRWDFQFPVVRRGIEVSDDESRLMVACIDYATYNRYVFIIYLD